MLKLVCFEIVKTAGQKKHLVMLAAFALMMLLLWYGYSHTARGLVRSLERASINLPVDVSSLADGLLFARFAMLAVTSVLIPVFGCTFAGDLIASELQDGTLRLYFSRGFSRMRLMAAKFITLYLFVFACTMLSGIAALGTGVLCFGVSPVQVVSYFGAVSGAGLMIMSVQSALAGYFISLVYLSFAMFTVSAVAFMLSSMFNRMTVAAAGGMAFYFISFIFEILPVTKDLAPYMVTRAVNASSVCYMTPLPLTVAASELIIMFLYWIVCFTVPVLIMNSKEV